MKKSKHLIAFVSAVSLHLMIGGVLLMNVDFSRPKDKPKKEAVVIQASVVSQKMFDDLAQRKENKKRAEQQKKIQARKEIERKKEAAKRQEALIKKQKADKIKAEKAEALRKKESAMKLAAEKELKEKKAAEKARKEKQAIEKEAERVKQEKLAEVKAAKIKADKVAAIEEKRKAAAEKERLRQAELDQQMEAEFADDFSTAQTAQQLSEVAKYEAMIRGKISRNWQLDPTMKGKSCTLAIKLAPDGLVLSANMSRGDQKLCDSARRAALRAKTLPIPKDPELSPQFRDFDITLEPEL